MKAVGWHQAMEKGKAIVPYAPAFSFKALKMYLFVCLLDLI